MLIIILIPVIIMLYYNADKRNIQQLTLVGLYLKLNNSYHAGQQLSNTKLWHTGLLYNLT